IMDSASTWTVLLPYIEQSQVYALINVNVHYNQAGSFTGTVNPFQTGIKIYVCPSNPYGSSLKDTAGYGLCDYMPTVYTDIDTATATAGNRNAATLTSPGSRAHGLLHNTQNVHGGAVQMGRGTKIEACADGTSNTICVIEDVSRGFNGVINGKYNEPGPTNTG